MKLVHFHHLKIKVINLESLIRRYIGGIVKILLLMKVLGEALRQKHLDLDVKKAEVGVMIGEALVNLDPEVIAGIVE